MIRLANNSAIAHELPNRRTLVKGILEDVNIQVEENERQRFRYRYYALTSDGWTNTSANSKLFVHNMLNMRNDHAFLACWNSSTVSQTAANIPRNMVDTVSIAGRDYGAIPVGFVIDNGANMKAAVKELLTVHGLSLFWATCGSHSGNLRIKSLVDPNQAQNNQIIVNEWKQPRCSLTANITAKVGDS
ncbi:hypothetical protein QAD02_000660 [Eretmocerus hayati]|uniref:Uncharacterized protein n=1 Tax=Eretmocerus hayati TaxID=131215 RepID=A0ACC2NFG6_9HYME|nr:hypothetical protein QAD02_000660 [Eretmocerus hayati]